MTTTTALVLTSWLGMVGAGLWLLVDHGVRPGVSGTTPAVLTDELAARLHANGEPLVVLCAHPQCPCLPSSLGELERALTGLPQRPDVVLLGFAPSRLPPQWDAAAVDALRHLPGTRYVEDRDGALANDLGAATSGHVVFYGADRRLRFSGGVTSGRAHVGDNEAGRTLGKTLRDGGTESATTAVFGCPLRAEEGPTNEPPCCRND